MPISMYLCKTGQTCLISSSGKIDACCRSTVLRLFGLVLLISLISSTQHEAEPVTRMWKPKKPFLMRERSQAEVMGMGQTACAAVIQNHIVNVLVVAFSELWY